MLARTIFLLVVVSTGFNQTIWAQERGPILPMDDPALWYYNALLARGYLSSLDAGPFPISESAFRLGLQDASTELGGVLPRLQRRLFSDSSLTSRHFGIRLRPGVSVANQEASNFLRSESNPSNVIYSLLGFESWFTAGNFTAAWGWRHDRYYDRDPEGLDTAHRWAIRPENAYISYSGKYANIMVGRVRRHWGGYSQPGFLLSDNPRPMDHLAFRVGTNRLNLSTNLSELDSITGDGRFTGTAGDDSVSSGSERRYLAVHKLTIAKPGSWSIGLMHSILYSGANSGVSLKFINPLQLAILSVDEKPKNEENNGLLGAFFQINRPSLLIQGQVAIDDFDLLNGKEPASLAATLFVYRANMFSHLDVSAGATVVTARTFNADQPEGKYLYLQRGIGTQYSDFVSAFASATVFIGSGTTIMPRLDVLFQGEGDFHQPFPAHDGPPALFSGVVERTIRPSVSFQVVLSQLIDMEATGGVNLTNNTNHINGASGAHFSGGVSISYRFIWDGAF